ncbi:MAG: potassium transporter TrkG [Thermodesulfobacteriota bacterium]
MRRFFPPISLPILAFLFVILAGALLLQKDFCLRGAELSFIDALFTTTSAVCVTGLTVVDTGTSFSRTGQVVIMTLIQMGGLGIMTLTSLTFFLWRRRISLVDRLAVGNSLLHDRTFSLGGFLVRMVMWTLLAEGIGAIALYLLAPTPLTPFAALFHAVSAFCNAGFSLYPDSLVRWVGAWHVNLVIMLLIVSGGIGFSVTEEIGRLLAGVRRRTTALSTLSWHSTIVLSTTVLLIVAGAVALYFSEFVGYDRQRPFAEAVLASLFQSVTCRTAGFNTLDVASMTNLGLLVMIMLMYIGGGPGSTAGGIKVTTFRVVWCFILAQLQGRQQARSGRFAFSQELIVQSLLLCIFSGMLIALAVLVLLVTEGGDTPHGRQGGLFMEVLFEAVSAFGTVGLSAGLTTKLSSAGKLVIVVLMFVGRLGPLVFLAALKELHRVELYRYPEENVLIG